MKNWFLIAFVLTHTLVFTQNTELGILIGPSFYTGDIEVTAQNFLPQMHPSVGVMMRQHFGEHFALRGMISINGLSGNEKKYPTNEARQLRGFNFTATVAELAIIPEWRPFSFGDVHFALYAGISGLYVNPKSSFNDQKSATILEDQNQKYPKFALTIPIGGGLHWNINETTALGTELGIRKTFTDYLDGFSASANPDSKDYYFVGHISFSKFFSLGNNRSGGVRRTHRRNRGVSCPTFN